MNTSATPISAVATWNPVAHAVNYQTVLQTLNPGGDPLVDGDWTTASAMDITLYWRTSATTGSVVWQVSTLFVGDAVVLNTAYNTASTVTDAAKGTTLQVNTAAITGVTASGTTAIGANKLAFVNIGRHAGTGSDDLAATAELIGFVITIRRTVVIGG